MVGLEFHFSLSSVLFGQREDLIRLLIAYFENVLLTGDKRPVDQRAPIPPPPFIFSFALRDVVKGVGWIVGPIPFDLECTFELLVAAAACLASPLYFLNQIDLQHGFFLFQKLPCVLLWLAALPSKRLWPSLAQLGRFLHRGRIFIITIILGWFLLPPLQFPSIS